MPLKHRADGTRKQDKGHHGPHEHGLKARKNEPVCSTYEKQAEEKRYPNANVREPSYESVANSGNMSVHRLTSELTGDQGIEAPKALTPMSASASNNLLALISRMSHSP
jgi:hypothetical protein